jgi:hypothetical protein
MIGNLYRHIIPVTLRSKIYQLFLKDLLLILRNYKVILLGKFVYYLYNILPSFSKKDAYSFIGKFGVTPYPGDYSIKYKSIPVQVKYDDNYDLHYVFHNGKKLFFTSQFEPNYIEELYRSLITEQDIVSPHRYVKDYSELEGKTLLDIGSAEGLFTLDVIDYISKVYLFEVEDFWIDALNATFEPWKEKVIIVKSYVGLNNIQNQVALDSFMMDKEHNNLFIKMDIEGAELNALKGATNLIANGENIELAICTYHHSKDALRISQFMHQLGYQTTFTNGYLYWGKMLNRVMLRGSKKNTN